MPYEALLCPGSLYTGVWVHPEMGQADVSCLLPGIGHPGSRHCPAYK